MGYGSGKGRSMLKSETHMNLSRHAMHHTPKHMAMMRDLMKKGKSFSEAHKQTMAQVGK